MLNLSPSHDSNPLSLAGFSISNPWNPPFITLFISFFSLNTLKIPNETIPPCSFPFFCDYAVRTTICSRVLKREEFPTCADDKNGKRDGFAAICGVSLKLGIHLELYSSNQMSKAPTKADWTTSRDAFFIKQLIEQQNTGKRSETGWSKEAWGSVLDAFNKKFRLENSVQQLKNRLAMLKKQYRFVKTVLDEDGFSWNDVLHTVNASDDVWDRYLLAHPEAKQFRKISLPIYDELGVLFEGRSAEGRGQISSIHPLPLEDGARASETSPSPCHVTVEDGTGASGTSRTPFHITAAGNLLLEGNGVDSKSSSEKDIPSEGPERNKRPSATPTTRRDKRVRMSAKNRIADALQSMVLASERLTQQMQEPMVNHKFSYARCLDELQQLEGLEESKLVLAVEALKDEKNAVAFMTLKGPLRLTWLHSICSGK